MQKSKTKDPFINLGFDRFIGDFPQCVEPVLHLSLNAVIVHHCYSVIVR